MNEYQVKCKGYEIFEFNLNLSLFQLKFKKERQEMQTSNEHLKKTLNLKSTQINQLLGQLKQTQQLCSNLKANYHKQENKFKERIKNLEYSLEQVKKQYREVYDQYNKLNRQSIQNEVRMKSMAEQWDSTLTVINRKVHSLESENQRLKCKIKQLQSKLQLKIQQNNLIQNKLEKKDKEIKDAIYAHSQLQKKHSQKQAEWQKWKIQILDTLDVLQTKRNEKKKMVNKLDALQDKIKTIITNI